MSKHIIVEEVSLTEEEIKKVSSEEDSLCFPCDFYCSFDGCIQPSNVRKIVENCKELTVFKVKEKVS